MVKQLASHTPLLEPHIYSVLHEKSDFGCDHYCSFNASSRQSGRVNSQSLLMSLHNDQFAESPLHEA